MKIVLMATQEGMTGENTAYVSQDGIEHISDVAEVFYQFLNAIGYNYVKQVVIVKADGSEVYSE